MDAQFVFTAHDYNFNEVCALKSSVSFKSFLRISERDDNNNRFIAVKCVCVHSVCINSTKCNRSASRPIRVNKFSFQALAKFMNSGAHI